MTIRLPRLALLFTLSLLAAGAAPALAQDRLCDPGDEECRNILLNHIRNETVAIEVAFWFMEDARYTTALIERHRAGVPVRVLMDTRANTSYPLNADRLAELQQAGIPMRRRLTSYILHWKMMLFHGQNVVQFSGANYSANAWRPGTTTPYENYTDEVIYFTSDSSIVDSFRTQFDNHWVDTSGWTNYANVAGSLVRRYPVSAKDPSLNFPPAESYRNRSVNLYKAEKQKIDVIMYRITDRQHTDAIIAAVGRGVQVRLITEPKQYRDSSRLWHSWNVDRLYRGGVQVKHRQHAGLNHQKSVILYGQNTAIFGSSNWTSPSNAGQVEHNLFTTKPHIVSWLVNQFERKWNNTGGIVENVDFVPLPPDTPKTPTPATGAVSVGTNLTLRWYGGPWAHLYDVYLGTTTNPTTLIGENLELGPSESSSQKQSFTVPFALTAGTTYYWKVVSKTMALQARSSPVWSFTTAGTAPTSPPPPSGNGDIVLYASEAVPAGGWRPVSDSSAAGGAKIRHPDAGGAKLSTALANPTHYFEMAFNAEAGRPYRLWIRGRADSNGWANDSVFVQFSGSVTSSGSSTWRIGTTSSTEVNLEDCSGCGLANWGWQDNGWGVNTMGPVVYFNRTGTHTIRVQTREDGLSIDQIVLSPQNYLSTSPGPLKNDTTILQKAGGGSAAAPPSPPPSPSPSGDDIVLHAGVSGSVSGGWRVEGDSTAASGTRVRHPNDGAAKRTAALANPVDYFELTFSAEAAKGYRLWVRGQADGNHWANDSVFVQFDRSVNASGSPIWRIGTTGFTEVNLEDCSGCGLANWGWQDNGWGVNVKGPLVYFNASGPQTIRVQTREDGLAIDQVVLSASTYRDTAPGALKNDTTIVPQ